MTTTAGLLALIAESALGDEIDRVAAAAGVRAVHLDPAVAPTRKTWSAAAVIVLDAGAARRCATAGLPRRPAVFVCSLGEPMPSTLQDAISVGAHSVLTMPDQADELVRGVGAAGDAGDGADALTVAVVAGRGGGGASLFAAALAHQLTRDGAGSLLVDLDPWGGGIDLLLGDENRPGLRWPDLTVQEGRLSWPAVRDALPNHRGVVVLSGTRTGQELPAGAVDAVLDASRRGGVTAVCDLPRRLTDATCIALEVADLVVLVTPCDVRSCAAASAMSPALTAINPNVGLVVRGPAPGGLSSRDIAQLTKLPLLAAMRPEPLIAEKLERDGLWLRRRSPLATAARQVAALLVADPGSAAVPSRRAA